MTEDQRKQFLARLTPLRADDPLLVGVVGIADELAEDAIREGGRLGVTGDDRAFLDGRQSALSDFKALLEQAVVEAQTPTAQVSH